MRCIVSLSKFIYWIWVGTCLLCTHLLQAQISEGGVPPSFNYATSLRSTQEAVQIPVTFSVEDLKTVDAWRVGQGGPLRVAALIDTDIHFDKEGEWVKLPDGNQVWQLALQAKEAVALMLYYDDFYIPEGGKLFIYNADKTHILGAYTNRTNPPTSQFATEFVAGDHLILEYVPAPSGESPRIDIAQVGYGYNHLETFAKTGAGASLPCMININCEEGNNWRSEQKGICRMVLNMGKYVYFCSGTLVNNTARDMTPYILSAFHCLQDQELNLTPTPEEFAQWAFYFHFERSGCDNNSQPIMPKTMIGCKQIAISSINGGSDGLLLKLNQQIPDNYDVFFNGWDRSNKEPDSGVGIHHPAGDYKKISTYGNIPVSSYTWLDADNNKGMDRAHWKVTFDPTANGYSIIEGGSSGSPLFNQNKQVVGTLSGGSTYLTCDRPNDYTLYGKMFYHWGKYDSPKNERMDIWLDPLNTKVTTLDGIAQNGGSHVGTERVKPDPTVYITPTLFDTQIRIPVYDRVRKLEIYSLSGQMVQTLQSPGEYVNTSHLSQGMYVFLLYIDQEVKSIQGIKK